MEEEILSHDAAAVEPAAAPTEAAPTEEIPFDPQQFMLNYKGQPIPPRDRQHLINLAQKGHSFEQSMEDLNKQKRDMEDMQSKFGKYEQMDKYFQENPAFANEITQLQARYAGGNVPEQDGQPTQGMDPQLIQRLDALEASDKRRTNEVEDYKVNQDISDLKRRYPDRDWKGDTGNGTLDIRLLQHAQDKGIQNLDSAYRDYFYDEVAAKAQNQTIAQGAEKQKEMTKAGIVQTGVPAAQMAQPFNVKGSSYDQIDAEAKKRLG